MVKEKETRKTPVMVTKLLKKAVLEKSQSAVSRETGLTLLTVQQYLKGIGEPRQKNLERLANYFGVSTGFLRGDNSFYEWNKRDSFANKFLTMASCHFVQALSDDYRKNGEVFYLQVVVELARLVIEIPDEMIREEAMQCRENAKKVIGKYEKYVSEYYKK